MSSSRQQYTAAHRDRAIGAFLGLALGDAVGAPLEFKARDTYSHITDLQGGGLADLKPGEWTDDTATALALAESLDAKDQFDPHDFMQRLESWYRTGEYSCTGTSFDIGAITSQAIEAWKWTSEPYSGSSEIGKSGNGSLMRLAPVSIRYWNDSIENATTSVNQSRTTHATPVVVEACLAFSSLLALAISGASKDRVLSHQVSVSDPSLQKVLDGSWRSKARHDIQSTGYVLHSLEAALWCVSSTSDFGSAVLLAANLGEDADTTASVTGQLAGALYGKSGLPTSWLEQLAWRCRLQNVAERLFNRSLND